MTAPWPHIHRRTGLLAAAAAIAFGFAAPAKATEEKQRAVKIGNSQLEPADWQRLDGWAEDDHLAAFNTFMVSCKPILRSTPASRASRPPMYSALYVACQAAVEAKPKDAKEAREYFEKSFRPVRITPLGESAGVVTGYYEPIVDGSRAPTEQHVHPLYRTPPGLLKGGKRLKTASFKRKQVSAKIARGAKIAKKSVKEAAKKAVAIVKSAKAKKQRGGRKLVTYHDRAAIEDGALKGRNLEIVYLKDPIDSFFIHIQGSARVRLAGGGMMRVNYDSQNGHPYYAVGKWLVDQKIYTREEMSMDRIRQWMTANPEQGDELRRRNKSYVFFREVELGESDEPVGAQGVSLTTGRSIAVDRNLHVYGTPFFIQAELPIESEEPKTPFRRLMVAQDTGGAIIGPARADIYYGAGDEAGLISGRFKQPGQFVMLFPKSVDPFPSAREIPLPKPRPANIPQDGESKPDVVAAKDSEARKAEAKPEAKKPEAKKPGVKQAAIEKPAAKPAATKPAATKPAAAKPAAKKPAAAKPAAAKPAKPKPAAAKPAAEAKPARRNIDPAPPT